MCVLISSTNFVGNICHSEKQGTRCDQKYMAVFMESARFSCPILKKLEFSKHFFFSKSTQIWNFKKFRPVEDEFYQTYRRTDMKLITAFHNFVNAPKNLSNVPPASKRWQRCPIELASAHRRTDRKKKKNFCLYFPFVFPKRTTHPTPLTACFLISSNCVLIKVRLKSAGKPSI